MLGMASGFSHCGGPPEVSRRATTKSQASSAVSQTPLLGRDLSRSQAFLYQPLQNGFHLYVGALVMHAWGPDTSFPLPLETEPTSTSHPTPSITPFSTIVAFSFFGRD